MNKFKSAMKTFGEIGGIIFERSHKIDQLVYELNRRRFDLNPVEARKIAAILVDHAEVTWK